VSAIHSEPSITPLREVILKLGYDGRTRVRFGLYQRRTCVPPGIRPGRREVAATALLEDRAQALATRSQDGSCAGRLKTRPNSFNAARDCSVVAAGCAPFDQPVRSQPAASFADCPGRNIDATSLRIEKRWAYHGEPPFRPPAAAQRVARGQSH